MLFLATAPSGAYPVKGPARIGTLDTAEESLPTLPVVQPGVAGAPGFEGKGPEAAPPLIGGTIESVDFDANAAITGFYSIPPDPMMAAGPDTLIKIVNTSIHGYSKAGVSVFTKRLGRNSTTHVGSFFESLTPINPLFDPKVIWDQYNNRFVVCALERKDTAPTSSRLLVAVSKGAGPNGGWWFTSINTKEAISGFDCFFDYPMIGVDHQAIYITGNMFRFTGGSIQGARLVVIAKAPFYTGGAAVVGGPYNAPALAGGGALTATMQPTHMYGAVPGTMGTFLVAYTGINDGVDLYLQVIRVDNPLGAIAFSTQFLLWGTIAANENLAFGIPGMPQLGTAQTIEGGDRRTLRAVWRNNNLWVCSTVRPPAGVDANQGTTKWWRVDTSNLAALAVADHGNVGAEDVAAGTHTTWSSIAVDECDNMAIGFAASAGTIYAGAYYTGRLATDAAGTVQSTGTLALGVDFYDRRFGGTRNRWGDYSGMCIDPDDVTFYYYNEYAGPRGTIFGAYPTEDGRYKTRCGKFSFGCGPVAVELARFEVERADAAAILRWEVIEATDHAGFHVFRSADGIERVQLTSVLLSGKTAYEFRDEAAPAEGADYWLQEVSRSGEIAWHGPATLGPASSSFRPVALTLAPGQPNPFRTATTVEYVLPSGAMVHLAVYDAQGRRIASLVDRIEPAGRHAASWDGRADDGFVVPSGLYLLHLEAAGQVRSQKVMFVK